jgi:3-deoxy-D-arabino-heptulosonate 7-phosphate (DAHP) synthase
MPQAMDALIAAHKPHSHLSISQHGTVSKVFPTNKIKQEKKYKYKYK